jgi:4-aminobutyrate aminotransferase
MTAADIVSPSDGKTLDTAARDEIVEQAFYKGLLLLGCGEAAIRFCPPLCISAQQIDTALDILSTLLSKRATRLVAV